MTRAVTIVDFGSGNLLSVARALAHCGADVRLAETPEAVAGAGHLVLPGVGAFAGTVAGLKQRGLWDAVRAAAVSGRPFLGICVGMQVLFDASEEFGETAGLGLVPGRVRRIAGTAVDGGRLKVPHIGWAPLEEPRPGAWASTALASLPERCWAYFVHSYVGVPDQPDRNLLAECTYGGHRLAAAVSVGAAIGVQFHPEKSGEAGLTLLRGFMTL